MSRYIGDTPAVGTMGHLEAESHLLAGAVQGLGKPETARGYGVSRQWVNGLLARHRVGGLLALRLELGAAKKKHPGPKTGVFLMRARGGI